ncbi:hypothetical protein M5D96_006173 [Drosophila gunungcola]|uniref:Uncharacterized protein n=1 Tax=Drosophila gunungcola TaxID=103775 RepID=A0A9P9YNG7_9MUSC|nr:hypothetical protein M5D96_006173 [Drosophila gunungcola]
MQSIRNLTIIFVTDNHMAVSYPIFCDFQVFTI